jgi:hypothetical protein
MMIQYDLGLKLGLPGVAVELIDPLPPPLLAREPQEGGQLRRKARKVSGYVESRHFILFENRTKSIILTGNRTQRKRVPR